MRFAYIDSQGKEVGIPSVEALGLRIELGAITPSTQLYDASADRWAPASEHEIFRTLSREIQEKGEGFVAPPPPSRSAGTGPPPGGEGPPAEERPPAADEAAPGEPEAPHAEPDARGPEPAEPAAERPERTRASNPFEMLDGPGGEPVEPEPPEPESPEPAKPPRDDGGFDIGIDLTLVDSDAEEPDEPAAGEPGPAAGLPDVGPPADAPPEPGPTVQEPGGFDFGDLGSLEVEGSSLADQDDEESAAVTDGGLELEDVLSASYGGGDDDREEDVPARGPASLWDDQGDLGADDDADEGFGEAAWARETAEEEPLDPEAEEARLREEAESRRAAARRRFDDGGEAPADGTRRDHAERAGRSRPARRPPARRRSGIPAGAIWGAVLLAASAAGWFGWSLLQDRREAAEVAGAEPVVVVPDIPAELEPVYAELRDAALGATLAELRSLRDGVDLPDAPPERWLSGQYMANAGEFGGVPAYFEAVRRWVAEVRGADSTAFDAAFALALEGAELPEGEAAVLARRAAAGFSAAGRERRQAYADLEAVVDATLSLHRFLLDNQDQIDYEPAAGGMSRDPVLEAVPATPAIGDEMWDRVDVITDALDRFGALDQVTTERLTDVLLGRVEAAGAR